MTDSRVDHRFNAPLPKSSNISSTIPSNYKPRLTPKPSTLRPHCPARDRLRLWIPTGGISRQTSGILDAPADPITEARLDRIIQVMGSSWAQSTKETYGAGLLVYHVFCDTHNVAEDKRCPISLDLLLSFISSCAGSYSGSTLGNYVAALKAWHLLHGRTWITQPDELKAMLDGAAALAPSSSKHPKRVPFTPEFIIKIHNQLDLNNPLDAAVFACLTTTFHQQNPEFPTAAMATYNRLQ
jgi:hypothetical protein